MANDQIFPTVTQGFLNKVRTAPDDVIFHHKVGTEWKGYTWKQQYERVRNISIGLMELGLHPGEKVCILSNTRIEWAVSDMAILGTKGITVPIYSSNTDEDCTYIINHCEAKFIFVEDQKQLEKIIRIKSNIPNIKNIFIFDPTGAHPSDSIHNIMSFEGLHDLGKKEFERMGEDLVAKNYLSQKPTDLFTICYTSGTTGVPKGVMLPFDCLTSVIEDIEKTMGSFWGKNDVVLSFLPMSHIFGKVEAMAAYHFGWKVYFAESIDKLFLNIAEVRPTALFAVPRIFEKAFVKIKSSIDESPIAKQSLFGLAQTFGKDYYNKIWAGKSPSVIEKIKYEIAKAVVFKKIYAKFGGRLRVCIAGGAPLAKDIGEFMQIIGISIIEGYGLTETCAANVLNPVGRAKFGCIGKPLPEVQIRIADDGEILIKSRKVMLGYYKNDEATKEVMDSSGWFHTGDIGHIDPDGYVKITDRKKDLIVTSGGKNVAPQKMENMAKSYTHISQIMVYGDKRNYLTALVVLDKETIIKYAKDNEVLFSEYSELVKNPKIITLVQNAFDDMNSKLASYETIKKFKILPNDFTVETGELTPSLKVKRKFCTEKFKKELDAMYLDPAMDAAAQP